MYGISLVLAVTILAYLGSSYGWINSSIGQKSSFQLFSLKYKEMMMEAMQKKAEQRNQVSENTQYSAPSEFRPEPSFQASASSAKQPWKPTTEPKTMREKASFQSKVPFDPEVYEVVKTAISLLTKRVNEKTLLTKEEAVWFKDAVEVILDDAHRFGPPPPPEREPIQI